MVFPFMNTYNRLPVVFSHGDGVRLTGVDGRRFLDFTSGIAVNCLGHNHPALVRSVQEQAARLMHVSNYYQSDVSAAFAEGLVRAAGMRNVFFCNSGAEANEGAIKIARKYSYKKYGPGRFRIVTLRGSFHGRTITALSATGQEKFHVNFGPFTDGFVFVPPNDVAALEAALADRSVCALLVEPVQGESGVVPLEGDFMRRAAALCAERDVLFMADEVQCGLGRTGAFLACDLYGVRPDVVTLAKGLCGGIPAGAVLAGEKCAGVLEAGDHGSTFGGNVLAAAAGLVVLEVLGAPGFIEGIAEKGAFLVECLRAAGEVCGAAFTDIRGRGLMVGADLRQAGSAAVIATALEQGLLVLGAGASTLRFLPAYIITKGEIEEGVGCLQRVLARL
jgi:acetylornithine/N-succinyldiaminopimelate aminotransferase